MKRLLGALHLPANRRYARYLRYFDDASLHRLLRPAVRDYFWLEWDRIATHYEVALSDRSVLEAAVAVDKLYYLPDDLLTKVDRTSMQFALEVRSPFMDPALLSLSANFSASQLRRKTLLRQAFGGDLPPEVFNRPKMGFAVPIGEWFSGPLRDMLRGTLLSGNAFVASVLETDVIRQMIEDHESGRADHSQRLYALLMLELWHQANGAAGRDPVNHGREAVVDSAGRATEE
jgi:asparagine synthase (glutamine-hydrolysing)